MPLHSCAVKGCPVKRRQKNEQETNQYDQFGLFRFPPHNRERLRKFLAFVNFQELGMSNGQFVNVGKICQNYFICERHFEERYISRSGRRVLLVGECVPTLNPPPNGVVPEPRLPNNTAHQHSQPHQEAHAPGENTRVDGLDHVVHGKEGSPEHSYIAEHRRNYIGHDIIEHHVKASRLTESSSSSCILDACEENIDASGLRCSMLGNVRGSDDSNVAETKLCPRRYENMRAKTRSKDEKNVVVEYRNYIIGRDNIEIEIEASSSQHEPSPIPLDLNDCAIDLPLSDTANNQCIAQNIDDYCSHEVPPSPSDFDSIYSVFVIHDDLDDPKHPLLSSSLPTTVSPQEEYSTSRSIETTPVASIDTASSIHNEVFSAASNVESMKLVTATSATAGALRLGANLTIPRTLGQSQ